MIKEIKAYQTEDGKRFFHWDDASIHDLNLQRKNLERIQKDNKNKIARCSPFCNQDAIKKRASLQSTIARQSEALTFIYYSIKYLRGEKRTIK